MTHTQTSRRAGARLLLTTALAVLAWPAQAALEYQLGGFHRAVNGQDVMVQDVVFTGGTSLSHSGGSTYFGPNDSVLVGNFGASRDGGSLTSGVLANAQYPLGASRAQTSRAIGLAGVYGDVLSFEGVSGSSFVTFGYRFTSHISFGPAVDPAYPLYSGVWADLYTLSATSDSLSSSLRQRVGYSYECCTGTGSQPKVILNGVQGQEPLTSFTYEGSFTMFLSQAYNRVLVKSLASRTEAAVNGLSIDNEFFFGASVTNGIDLWIDSVGQPGITLASSLSGHDYAYIAASPVPEPGTAWLLGAGAVLMGAWRQRQRRPARH